MRPALVADRTPSGPPVPVATPGEAIQRGGIVAAEVIYQAEVIDPERYEEYKTKAAASIVAAGGGRYLVRGGDVEVLEGDAPAGRTVVLEFPTMQAALDWCRSEEYTAIRTIREGAAQCDPMSSMASTDARHRAPRPLIDAPERPYLAVQAVAPGRPAHRPALRSTAAEPAIRDTPSARFGDACSGTLRPGSGGARCGWVGAWLTRCWGQVRRLRWAGGIGRSTPVALLEGLSTAF